MNILKGRLSYLLAGIGLIWGIYQLVIGEQEQGITTVYAALALFGVRRAIG